MDTRGISFDRCLKIKQSIANELDYYSKILDSFPRDSMGLVSEEVRSLREYKYNEWMYKQKHKQYRDTNGYINKYYKKELKELLKKIRSEKINE